MLFICQGSQIQCAIQMRVCKCPKFRQKAPLPHQVLCSYIIHAFAFLFLDFLVPELFKNIYIYLLKKYKQGKQAGMSRSPAAVLWFAFLSQTRHEMPGWSDRLKSFKGIINHSWRHFLKVVTSHLWDGCTQICFKSPWMCVGLTIWLSRWAAEESRPTCGYGALCPFALTGCCLSAHSPV